VNLSPVLALAGLAAIGLLVTRLPLPARRRVPWLDPVLAAGGPLVLLGIILGPGAVPGIGFLDGSVLRSLAPVTALAIGWIGAGLGAQFEWRSVRRISRRAWLLAALPSGAAFGAVALGAWMLTRALPALAAAWTPRLAAILTLAAVAAVSGPGVVALVAREAGLRRSTARGLVLAASLETLVGALLFFVPVALHRGDGLTTIAFAVGSAALVGVAFLSLMRVWPAGADIGFAVLATLAFGAGVGYATGLSPFVVCALAAVVIVHASPPARRHAIRRVLAEWERPVVAVLLVITCLRYRSLRLPVRPRSGRPFATEFAPSRSRRSPSPFPPRPRRTSGSARSHREAWRSRWGWLSFSCMARPAVRRCSRPSCSAWHARCSPRRCS